MKVMVIVKANQDSEAGILPSEKLFADMGKFNEELAAAGMLVDLDGLKPSSKGARVTYSGGQTTITDGPFSETKELVAGYWIWNVDSLEQAIEWAKRCPNTSSDPNNTDGNLEIRPLYDGDGATGGDPSNPATGKRYMGLLLGDKNTESGYGPSDAMMQEMGALMEDMAKRGIMISAGGLRPSSEGARVKFHAGGITVTDGPFTESKELIAGYCVYRAASLEEAVEGATRFLKIHVDGTGIDSGTVEIRPFFEAEDFKDVSPDVIESEATLREQLASR